MNRLLLHYYSFRNKLLKKEWDRSAVDSRINGIVLMYHEIVQGNAPADDPCVHSLDEFESLIKHLKAEGYIFVSPYRMNEIIERKSNEKFALITFDDVHSSVYHLAFPAMRELGVPFLLFMTTDFIGKEGYLTEAQLKEMDSYALCTVGSHTQTHPMLRFSKNKTDEIAGSKSILEDILGHRIDFIAYPFGRSSSVSRKVRKITEKAGYKLAFGTIDSPVTDLSSKSRFYLPRVVIR